MNAIIIEDEPMMAEDLANLVSNLSMDIKVTKILTSVQESIKYFSSGGNGDLVFSDIELGDGRSFEIFRKTDIKLPVIFCTAYDHYTITAINEFCGVGYITKPYNYRSIHAVVSKFLACYTSLKSTSEDHLRIGPNAAQHTTILINWKDKIIPLRFDQIALFQVQARNTFAITDQGVKYPLSNAMEEIEKMAGDRFFRANRQYLINRVAIREIEYFSSRRLWIHMQVIGEFDITVAKAKIPEFLQWLRLH